MKATTIYNRLALFLLPILFLPVVSDGFGWGKNWLFMAGAALGLAIYAIEGVVTKNERVRFNKFLWWWLVLAIWTVISWWRLPLGIRARSIGQPFGAGMWLAAAAWVFLWLQSAGREEAKRQINYLTAGAAAVAVLSVAVFLIPAGRLPFLWPAGNPLVNITGNWSLAGSLTSELFLMGFLAWEWLKRLMKKLKDNDGGGGYLGEAGLTAFFMLVLFLDFYKVTRTGLTMMDRVSGWVVAVEAFKRAPVWGVGVGNFVRAFNLYRPASYNMGPYWSSLFEMSSSAVLQIWTEMGVPALALMGILVFYWLVMKRKNMEFWRLGVLLWAFLLLPYNLMGLILLLWVVANRGDEIKQGRLLLKVGETGFNILPVIFSAVLMIGVAFGGYWWGRIMISETRLRKSLVAAAANNAGGTYDWQIKAIGINPYNAEIRRIYSQTNLAIAVGILNKEELTDEDKERVGILFQQAVQEAKAAISLDSGNAIYWANLASIYKNMIGLVEGAPEWSFQAYQQAVLLDPVNPILRLEMGGLLYAVNRVEDADRVFEQVVINKRDFANGWYNWAYTAKKLNKLTDAVTRMGQVVALVPADSADFDKASKELAEWKVELEKVAKPTGAPAAEESTLTPPQTLPTINPEEKVEVPSEELEPPRVTPLPSPSPAATGEEIKPTAVPTTTATP